MKILSLALVLSTVSGASLFEPIYQTIARTIVDTIAGYVQKAADSTDLEELSDFAQAIKDLETDTVVDIIRDLPVDTIINAGNLTSDEIFTIFNEKIDMADINKVGDELLGNLTPEQKEKFNNAMDGLFSAFAAVKNIVNSEITPYNFAALITDLLDSLQSLDDVFPDLITGYLETATEVLHYAALAVEKSLYVYDIYDKYVDEIEKVIKITNFKYEDEYDLDKSFCEMVDANIVVYSRDVFKFTADIIKEEMKELLMKGVEHWNSIWDGLPLEYLKIDKDIANALVEMIKAANEQVIDTMQDLVLTVSPFMGFVNPYLNGFMGCQ